MGLFVGQIYVTNRRNCRITSLMEAHPEQITLAGCWVATVADDAANGFEFAQRLGMWAAFFAVVHFGTVYGE